jgi:hypothetical protein
MANEDEEKYLKLAKKTAPFWRLRHQRELATTFYQVALEAKKAEREACAQIAHEEGSFPALAIEFLIRSRRE